MPKPFGGIVEAWPPSGLTFFYRVSRAPASRMTLSLPQSLQDFGHVTLDQFDPDELHQDRLRVSRHFWSAF